MRTGRPKKKPGFDVDKLNEQTGEEVYIVSLCNSCNTSGPDMDIVLDEDVAGLRLIWNESDVKK